MSLVICCIVVPVPERMWRRWGGSSRCYGARTSGRSPWGGDTARRDKSAKSLASVLQAARSHKINVLFEALIQPQALLYILRCTPSRSPLRTASSARQASLTRRRVSTLPKRLHREAAAARRRSDVDADLAHETGVARKDASATTGPAAPRECAATDAARPAADGEYNRPEEETRTRGGRQ